VPIAEVRAGDSVWGVSAETGGWVLSKVLGVSARDYDGAMVAVTIRNSRGQEETLHATGGHPFWIQTDPVASATRFWKQFATSGGADADGSGWVLPTPQGLWVAAEQLQLGDQLLDRQDGPATITGLRITRERQRVYNLTVLRIHNYAVGESGVLVHNGKCVGKGKKASSGGGPYGHLNEPTSAGPGKKFTQAQKQKIRAENQARNGGVLRDDSTGEALVQPQKSQRGVTPPTNEAQVDHVYPRSEGGPNSYSNAEVRSRTNNIRKSNKI